MYTYWVYSVSSIAKKIDHIIHVKQIKCIEQERLIRSAIVALPFCLVYITCAAIGYRRTIAGQMCSSEFVNRHRHCRISN